MDQQEVRTFVESFFKLRECRIIHQHPSYITVELNPETDRDLGYRPFYWSYVDSMGIKPQLLQQTYIFDPSFDSERIKGELVQFGTNRLRQIFSATRNRGQFVRLYEDRMQTKVTGALFPWLLINYKIEYICDQKKEKLYSVGLNMVTGELLQDMYQIVQRIPLTPKLPPYVYTQSPVYSFESSIAKIEDWIANLLRNEDDRWAREAEERYVQEIEQTEKYYEDLIHQYRRKRGNPEEMDKAELQWCSERKQRLEELEWQYKPRIEVKTINQGLIYLITHPSKVSNKISPLPLYI